MNIKNDENHNGLLTCRKEEYENALAFDIKLVEVLFEKDSQFWADDLEAAREDATRIENEVQAVLRRSMQEM